MPYTPKRCDNCHQLVPEAVCKCQNCMHTIYNRLSKDKFPQYDKFGNSVTVLSIDGQKESARNAYIDKQLQVKLDYDFSQDNFLCPNEDPNQVKSPLATALLILPWVLCPLILVLSYFLGRNIIIGMIVVMLYSLFTIIAIKIVETKFQSKRHAYIDIDAELNKLEKYENNCMETDLTILKDAYYFSDKSIGYSKATLEGTMNGERTFAKFAFYELEKDLVTEIKYNTKYAGYELYTTMPILDDEMKLKDFWFIPDVFDDTALSIALGRDLPLKHINF